MDIKNKLNLPLGNDKIILAIACLYFFGVLFWLTQQQKQPTDQTEVSSANSKTSANQSSPQQTQFIQYLKTSLKQLEKGQSLNPVSTNQNSQKSVTLPSYSLPAVQSVPTVVERIYVPVYPPQNTSSPNLSTLPPTMAKSIPPPPPPAPQTEANVNREPIISLQQSPQQPPPSESVVNELIGLLSGDRGFVLVKINGSTQRFEPGELIGSSGWVLDYVVDQTAVISRNGQQQAVEVGQRF